ncbi:PRC-barrel domain-containing protein [Albimonas sp. CAU 1670]|uniref:PRC-barrel domain-containing protein n=1 Tax=Albimonas sp. CAU 1670 TaxID=3032599 RepID=UPI0023DA9683|nr:PRC-barrel domain-containing protein [Albimonas sp. CAU 1670]MDF2232775.1 PRC-barrel domain-containing protein [Albimonas sp. CAU 1670]
MKTSNRFALLAAAAIALPLSAYAQSNATVTDDDMQAGRDEPAASATDAVPSADKVETGEVLNREPGETEAVDRDAGAMATTDAAAPAPAATRSVMVRDLDDLEVVGADGEELGELDGVIRSADGDHLVIERGGFLGIGEKHYVIPVEVASFIGDELHVNLTEADLEAMIAEDPSDDLELAEEETVQIRESM